MSPQLASMYAACWDPSRGSFSSLTRVLPQSEAQTFAFFSGRSRQVLSEQNIRFMREAIAVHERVFDPGGGQGFLPTQLLDLGDDTANTTEIHLVLRDDMSDTEVQNAECATLSYC